MQGVFRHHYRGPLMAILPRGGSEIHATPDHEFLVSAPPLPFTGTAGAPPGPVAIR